MEITNSVPKSLFRTFICLLVLFIILVAMIDNYNLWSFFYSKPQLKLEISSHLNSKLLQKEFRLINSFDYTTENGLPFDTKWNTYLNVLNLLDIQNVSDDATVLLSEPIIGTALSSNHFKEFLRLLDSLVNVYRHQLKKIVYVYDLGLSWSEQRFLMNEYGTIIKEIRKFAFDKYPSNFKKLKAFRWKPIVVAELLKDFPSIWWMDASVRVYKPLSQFYMDIHQCLANIGACDVYPWSLINDEGLSIWAGTDNRTYKYLPIAVDKSKNLTMYAATVQLIFATKEVRENVLRYWVLCAFQEECMDPKDSYPNCHWNGYHVFQGNTYTVHGGCNLQDQSAINIILARVNQFNTTRYARKFNGTLEICRT